MKHPCLLAPEEIERAKKNIAKYPKAGELFADMKRNADWWTAKSDSAVIGLIPSAVDRRAMYPNE